MKNTSYVVIITNTHQLLVNDRQVSAPEGIQPGDSEHLLAWALDRVSDAHTETGGTMTLTVRDNRDDGYGTFEHVMHEGEDITIEDVRRRTGKDYSARTPVEAEPPADEPVVAPTEDLINAETLREIGGDVTPETPSPVPPARPNLSTPVTEPEQASASPAPASAVAPKPSRVEPQPGPAEPAPEVVVGPLPFQPLEAMEERSKEGEEDEPKGPAAFQPTEEERQAEEREAEERRTAREQAEVAEAAQKAREEAAQAARERAEAEAKAEAERQRVNAEIEAVAAKHNKGLFRRGKGPKPPREKKSRGPRRGAGQATDSSRPAKPRREAKPSRRSSAKAERVNQIKQEYRTAADKDAQKRGWMPFDRPVPRPEIEKKEIRKRKARPWLWALLLIPLALLFGYKYYMDNKAEVHVAVCIDERTMTREATDAACEDPKSPVYNRWFYVPRGSTVPAVGSRVDTAQGSLQPPSEDATVVYGYAENGGVFKKRP